MKIEKNCTLAISLYEKGIQTMINKKMITRKNIMPDIGIFSNNVLPDKSANTAAAPMVEETINLTNSLLSSQDVRN